MLFLVRDVYFPEGFRRMPVLRIMNILFTKKMSRSDVGFCMYNEAQVSETLMQPIKLPDEVSFPWLGG